MRRLISAIVVPIAFITAFAITATAADAGLKRAVKTKVTIEKVTTPPPNNNFVFKGRVTSRNDKCLGKRGVQIFRQDQATMRGVIPPGPIAVGKTKDSGKFAIDTNTNLLAVTDYVAVVLPRNRGGVSCMGASSKPFFLN